MSIESSIQIIAAIIGAIYGLIQIWKLAYNLKDKEVAALKNSISIVIWLVSLFVGLIGFALLFVFEAMSPEPISRLSIAKMVFFGVMLSSWLVMHLWYLLVRIIEGHHAIIGGIVEVASEVKDVLKDASNSTKDKP